MTTAKIPLIIPVENQVRELDPKLLLACRTARSTSELHRFQEACTCARASR